MDKGRAARLRHLANCEGWDDLASMLDQAIAEYKEALYHKMSLESEDLTKQTSLKLAAKAKALEDFKDSILDANKVAP